MLLDTCGQYFCSGSSKKKLDYFLLYFQRYYWFKRSCPLYADESKFPLGVANLVNETIVSLRWVRYRYLPYSTEPIYIWNWIDFHT